MAADDSTREISASRCLGYIIVQNGSLLKTYGDIRKPERLAALAQRFVDTKASGTSQIASEKFNAITIHFRNHRYVITRNKQQVTVHKWAQEQ